MTFEFTGVMPMQPHLLKFVYWMENMEPGEPIDLTKKTMITRTMLLLFTPKKQIPINDSDTVTNQFTRFTVKLKYSITLRQKQFKDFYISRSNIALFNDHMHLLFHEILTQRILTQIHSKKEKTIVEDYLKEIGADDDIDWHTVKRTNGRLRGNKEIPTIHQLKAAFR